MIEYISSTKNITKAIILASFTSFVAYTIIYSKPFVIMFFIFVLFAFTIRYSQDLIIKEGYSIVFIVFAYAGGFYFAYSMAIENAYKF